MLSVALVAEAALGAPAAGHPPQQDAAEESDARSQAGALLAEGNRRAAAGDFTEALKRFRAAHELYPSPKLLLNIGTTLRHLGRDAEAAAVYEQYLVHPEAQPAHAAEVETVLGEIEATVGRITMVLNVADARVRLDGQVLPVTGRRTSVRVDPGDHTLVAEKASWQAAIASVRVGEGEHQQVELRLFAPGEPPPDGRTQRIVAYSIGGLAGAGIVLGAVFGGLFLSSKSVADDHCDAIRCDPEGGEAVDDAQSQGMVANIAFAAGAVAAAASIVVYLTAPSDEPGEEPSTSAALRLGPARGASLELCW